MIGEIIAHYRITAKLGAGGMGEVYRATDTKLGRDVALKILPEAFAADAERIARFTREAQVLAALNHPNIAAIYGVEDRALVMELVEGETVSGPLPLETALAYARQIVDALEAAHEKGIVHRDLKPANIMITPAGVVKVLDFGLATVVHGSSAGASDPAKSPTLTMGATQAGVILGTAGYMAPEQARGKPVDKRADIWAFGAVLYEMLTGRRLFRGEDVSDTLAAVIKEEPRWDGVPAKVERLLRSCLEKDPRRRLRDIGDVWRLLEDAPAQTTPSRSRFGVVAVASLASVVAVVAAGLGWILHTTRPEPRPVARWTVTLPESSVAYIALARDGTRLVYGDGISSPLVLRVLNQFEGKPLAGTEGGRGPVFSPDGQWIAYLQRAALKKVPVTGGAPITVYEGIPESGRTWGEDDTIIFGSAQGLMRVSAAGGTPQALTKVDAQKGESIHAHPQFLPGGQAVLFTISMGRTMDSSRIAVLDLKKGSHRVVVDGGYMGRYVPTGHVVYGRGGTMFAVPFDAGRLAVTGSAAPAIEGITALVSFSDAALLGATYSFSDSGLLVYLQGIEQRSNTTLEWVDRKGAGRISTLPPRDYQNVRLSPDGQRVAAAIRRDASNRDIWICELERGALTRLTFEGRNLNPVWTPDGRRVTFASSQGITKNAIYWAAADGSGKPELLLPTDRLAIPACWTPDGKALLYEQRFTAGAEGGSRIWILPIDGSGGAGKPRPFLETSFTEANAQVSPDGQWVAYQSNESGKFEVYVRPFPGPGGKVPISTQGGGNPRWSRNGRELFYADPKSQLIAVDLQTIPAFRAGQPRVLFGLPGVGSFGPLTSFYGGVWDAAPDGTRFLVGKAPEAPAGGTKLQVVTDWFEELRRRAR